MLVFVLNNQTNLHAACRRSREETNQTAERRREVWSCSLPLYFLAYFLFSFFFLENAVSTMFVTNCTLVEPLLKESWIAFTQKRLIEILFKTLWVFDLLVLGWTLDALKETLILTLCVTWASVEDLHSCFRCLGHNVCVSYAGRSGNGMRGGA